MRKSYRESDDTGEAVVYLAAAFEILLTDNYASGISKRIVERIDTLLKGVKGSKIFSKSVEKLYDMRSEYVHSGFVEDTIEINVARNAFIHTFINLCSRLDKIPNKGNEPIKAIIENT